MTIATRTIEQARRLQGDVYGNYPRYGGIDDWQMATLATGTLVGQLTGKADHRYAGELFFAVNQLAPLVQDTTAKSILESVDLTTLYERDGCLFARALQSVSCWMVNNALQKAPSPAWPWLRYRIAVQRVSASFTAPFALASANPHLNPAGVAPFRQVFITHEQALKYLQPAEGRSLEMEPVYL